MRSLFGNSPSELRSFLGLASVFSLSLAGGVALAEEPIVSSDAAPAGGSVVTQSTTTTVTTAAPTLPAPPVVAAPPAVSAPAAPPVVAAPPLPPAPPVAAPLAAPPGQSQTSAGTFQGPVYYNGPVWIVPAPMNGQAVAPPQLPPPPVYGGGSYAPPPVPYYAPPPPYYVAPPRPLFAAPRYVAPRYTPPKPRGPVVGLGLRFSVLGVASQQVFGQNVTMYGGGLFMRFRSQGRFGFELGMDVLRSNINDGAFVRMSYPFSLAPMMYIFQNRPENHFNIYFLAGVGLMADSITLYKDSVQERNQSFWEVLGQAGGGMELRFTKLALFADVRAIGMLLDDKSPAGIFYQNADGGPIPAHSAGYKVNAGALIWF